MSLREQLEQAGLTPNQVAYALTKQPSDVETLLTKVDAKRGEIRNVAAYIATGLRDLAPRETGDTTTQRVEPIERISGIDLASFFEPF